MKAKIIIDGKECEIVLTKDQKTEIEKISKEPMKEEEGFCDNYGNSSYEDTLD